MTEKIKVVVYVANDGTEFNTKEECYKYEAEVKKVSSFMRTLKAIKEFCEQKEKCLDCPFCDGSFCKLISADMCKIPRNWKI